MKINNLNIKRKVCMALLSTSILLLTTGFDNKEENFEYGYTIENNELKKWPVGDNFNRNLDNIEQYQKFEIVSSIGSWYKVLYNGKYGYIRKKYVNGLSEKYIEIDISEQKLDFYIGKYVMLSTDIVSGQVGSKDTETRIGCFDIDNFQKNTYLVGKDYKQFVKYWIPFDGGIGLHDASWRSEFGNDIYLTNGSHGCINLPESAARDIYDNSFYDTKILVHK